MVHKKLGFGLGIVHSKLGFGLGRAWFVTRQSKPVERSLIGLKRRVQLRVQFLRIVYGKLGFVLGRAWYGTQQSKPLVNFLIGFKEDGANPQIPL
ncbi:hypothetical protein CEXT_742911 [Caerostris extrusa]|uniref:Uncharacterized protein n=1 Tax=Caerostris extrusa TaxID=172846 RepID=A0AAV4VHS7_CAEEX|nr:hypothetical protein CEXT_742911 [Caerostris extrusa]